ncbi:hypothetical protein ABEW34_17085 [Paenibacillus algorifonticola]|uniref:hypothetical protein n=1 Tax=Paenibacillus algorifonticola TaxID=684063 RepID=UPI003D27B181
MENSQLNVVSELNKSINHMMRFGQELESLDSRFGRVERRIESLLTSAKSLNSQVNKQSGSSLREQLENEMTALVSNHVSAIKQSSNTPVSLSQDKVRQAFSKVEKELNSELQKLMRNIQVEMDPGYAMGQRMSFNSNDFNEVSKELAKLMKQQLASLAATIDKNKENLISAPALDGLEMEISQETLRVVVGKIKQQILGMISSPVLAGTSARISISAADMNKVIVKAAERLKRAFNSTEIEDQPLDTDEIKEQLSKIPQEIELGLEEYVDEIILGINEVFKEGKDLFAGELGKRLQSILSREISATFSQINQYEAAGHEGNTRFALRTYLDRVTQVLDRKLLQIVGEGIESIIGYTEEAKIEPSLQLKRYLTAQMNRLNISLVQKIREQFDDQVNSIIREIETSSGKNQPLNMNPAGNANANPSTSQPAAAPAATTTTAAPVVAVSAASSSSVRNANDFLTIANLTEPLKMLNQSIETYKFLQVEQMKLIQSFMLKDNFRVDDNGNPTGMANKTMIDNVMTEINAFINAAAVKFGVSRERVSQVVGVATGYYSDPAEIKKMSEIALSLQSMTGGSEKNILTGAESLRQQFGLEVADVQKQIAEPAMVVSNQTNIPIEQLLDITKRSRVNKDNSDISPALALLMTGAALEPNLVKGLNTGYNPNLLASNNKNNVYTTIFNELQSDKAQLKLGELGIKPSIQDEKTGQTINKTGEEIFEELVTALRGKGDVVQNEVLDSILGKANASSESAMMHEVMNRLLQLDDTTQEFVGDPKSAAYNQMLQQSLDNPLVNANRAMESISIAFGTVIDGMAPSIKKLSTVITNLANNVSKNAELFHKFGDVLSSVLLGMLLIKGLKWGASKSGIGEEMNVQKRQGSMANFLKDLHGSGLISDDLKNTSRRNIGLMQKSPELDAYIRSVRDMTVSQKQHFKNYLTEMKVDVKDIPTLFTAMDEAKKWKATTQLTDDEKFERQRQYNNRIKNSPELAGQFSPNFLNQLNSSTSDQNRYNSTRIWSPDFDRATNRMTSMSPSQFKSFESHLSERSRNGLPNINNYRDLTQVLGEYDQQQRQVDTTARQTSSAFGNLSHAVRGLNTEMTRSQRMSNGMKGFLKDIPSLAKGAGKSIAGLAASVASMGLEMVGAIVLGESLKAISWEATATKGQKQQAIADTRDSDERALTNTLYSMQDGFFTSQSFSSMASLAVGDFLNSIDKFVGASPSHSGAMSDNGFNANVESLYNYYWSNGAQFTSINELIEYIESQGKTLEEGIYEWSVNTGRKKETDKLKQEAANSDYTNSLLTQKEEERLLQKAKENQETKLREGTANVATITKESVESRIEERLQDRREKNSEETIKYLFEGDQTVDEYLHMRRAQVTRLQTIYNEELNILNSNITKAQEKLDNTDENTFEYREAWNNRNDLEATRMAFITKFQPIIMMEDINYDKEFFQKRVGEVNLKVQRIGLSAQAEELAAAYNMDTESKSYLDKMKQITSNKLTSLRKELSNLKAIKATGDQAEELTTSISQMQNSISSEQAKLKEYALASIGIGRENINDSNSQRENDLLALKVKLGNPADDSAILRNKRIANAKSEISEITSVIADLKGRLPGAGVGETVEINTEIRDLQKQSLQAQLGILDEMKSSAGTFNMPNGVQAMSRYEYLTRGNTHNSTTIGTGDVTVNITLPNVTNGTTASQLQAIGQSLGQGLSVGRVGNLRNQMAMNPGNYRLL